MTYLPSRELARLASIDRTWRDSARLIYRTRIFEAFSESGLFRYVFGTFSSLQKISHHLTDKIQRQVSQPSGYEVRYCGFGNAGRKMSPDYNKSKTNFLRLIFQSHPHPTTSTPLHWILTHSSNFAFWAI